MRLCTHCGKDISHRRKDARLCDKRCAENARHKANPEVRREQDRARNVQKAKHQADWRARNPDAARAQRTKQRAARKTAPVLLITTRDITRLLARHGGACAYCGSTEKIEMDHVVPLSRGGRHSIGNLLPACLRCNRGKSKKFLTEWR